MPAARPTHAATRPVALALLLAVCGLPLAAQAQPCNFLNPPPVTDDPDPNGIDSNGDGIDGMACGPIFVSPLGADSNPGTMAQPMRSVAAAVAAASLYSPRRDVYVATGTYTERIATDGPIRIFGGFDPNTWARTPTRPTIDFSGHPVFIDRDTSAAGATLLSFLHIHAAGSPAAGHNNVCIVKRNPGGTLSLVNCRLDADAGTAGVAGASGAPVPTAPAGNPGQNGVSSSSAGGIGGAPPVAANPGGRGGNGGYDNGSGLNGLPGSGGAAGGSGAAASACFSGGNMGGGGTGGAAGSTGSTGAPGAFALSGGDGNPGTPGHGGGGGGGGGGGIGAPFCNADRGGGGGSGGAGGGAGNGGFGGGAGGSSVGIIAHGGTVSGDVATAIVTSTAGNGGAGGAGSAGGIGGNGGPGGAGADDGGPGGPGGRGGNGGAGGGGGGGGGGSSAGAVRLGAATVTLSGSTTTGSAGLGGASPGGPPGATGVSAVTATANAAQLAAMTGSDYAPTAVQCRIVCLPNTPSGGAVALGLDPDGDVASYSLLTAAVTGGTASQVGPTNFMFTPDSGFSGWTSFQIRATDSGGRFVDGYAVVYVKPVCRPDYDGNGAVEPADIATFVSDWFAAVTNGCPN